MIPYKDFYDYDRLERIASGMGFLENEAGELALLNLHNHLVWHSYRFEQDPIADAIFYAAITEVMAERGAGIIDVPQEFRCALSERR